MNITYEVFYEIVEYLKITVNKLAEERPDLTNIDSLIDTVN